MAKIIMRHGIEGYGLYFACLEIIAEELTPEKFTFELEHDAELLAGMFRMDTRKVEKIMFDFIELGLFEVSEARRRVACYKLAKRLDNTLSQNPEVRKILTNFKDLKATLSDLKQIRLDEIRLDEKEPKDIMCLFQVRIDDLASKYPLVDVDKVKMEIIKWVEKHPHRRGDDVKINQKIIDIMEHEQNRAEKRCQLKEVFETLWSQYPKKDGDKKKVRYKIERQITTEQDIDDIQNAFTNYMEHVRTEREGGFPDLKYKGRETWFNNWRSWVEWEPPQKEETTPHRPLVGGYVVK